MLGRTRPRIMLDGTSQTMYEVKKTRTMMEYCVDVSLKSSSSPPALALPMLARSTLDRR